MSTASIHPSHLTGLCQIRVLTLAFLHCGPLPSEAKFALHCVLDSHIECGRGVAGPFRRGDIEHALDLQVSRTLFTLKDAQGAVVCGYIRVVNKSLLGQLNLVVFRLFDVHLLDQSLLVRLLYLVHALYFLLLVLHSEVAPHSALGTRGTHAHATILCQEPLFLSLDG